MTDVVATQPTLTPTKKYILIGTGVIILVCAVLGVFVPDAREFAMGVIKALVGGVEGVIK